MINKKIEKPHLFSLSVKKIKKERMVEKARVRTTTNPIIDIDYDNLLRCLSKTGKDLESLDKESFDKEGEEEAQNQLFLYDDDDDDIDPDFQNVLSCLKECGNSYLLEEQNDGFVTVFKYEQDQDEDYSCSEREFDQEPKRKARSVPRKENGVSNLSERVEIESRKGSKSYSGNKGGNFSRNNSISNEYEKQEEAHTCSEREFGQDSKRKVNSVSRKENEVSNLSKVVEIVLKSNSGNKGGSNSVNNECEEQPEKQEKENTLSEKECEQEPKRKLRSALKKENGVSKLSKGVEKKSSNGSKPNSGNKGGIFNGCQKGVKFGTLRIEPDPDYYRLLKNCEFSDDGSMVYKYKGGEVIYGKNNEEVKNDDNDSDGRSSDCEFIESDEFHKKEKAKEEKVKNELKRQLIANLKRPYDQQEYDRLWRDVSICKPTLHHKELRKGRELSCATDTAGKSYLQQHPDFNRKLNESRDDKPKCLTLLRGFFFWYQNPQLLATKFKPWEDQECLSLSC